MKNLVLLLLTALFTLGMGIGDASAKLPKTYAEFKARYQTEGKTPEGALKLHMEAIFCYLNPETRSEASKMLRYSLYLSKPLEQSYNYSTFVERMKDPECHYTFRSYCKGTSPENNYAMSPDDFSVNIVRKRNSEGYLKLDVKSSGADSTHAVWLLNHDGLWYVDNNAPLYLLVRKPKAPSNAHDADFDTEPIAQSVADTPSAQPPQPEPAPASPVPAVQGETAAAPAQEMPVVTNTAPEELMPQSLPDLNAPQQP